jgi:hypothetical protein
MKLGGWKNYLSILIVSVLGALTHYYCIVYLAFISCVYGVYLIIHKKWKSIVLFIATMVAAGEISITIFPAMTDHMFSGYRGTQSIDNLENFLFSDYLDRLKSFYGYINGEILGSILSYIVVFAVFLIIMQKITHIKNFPLTMEKIDYMKCCILFVPSIFYFLIVSKMAAYVVDRYLYPIYAVAFVGVMIVVYYVIKSIVAEKFVYLVVCGICILISVNSWKYEKWDYLYISSDKLLSEASEYSNVDCVYLYDVTWKAVSDFYEVSRYQSVTFIPVSELEMLNDLECVTDSELVVKVIGNADTILKQVIEYCPNIDSYDKVGEFGYSKTYHLYQK